MTNHSFQKTLDGYDAATDAVDDSELRLPWETLLALAPNGDDLEAIFKAAILDAVTAAIAGDAASASAASTGRDAPAVGAFGAKAPATAKHKKKGQAADTLADDWRPGQFAFLGVDFILDADGNPYLIEFSKAPGIRETPDFLYAQNRTLIPTMLDLVLQARTHWLKSGPVDFMCTGDTDDPVTPLKRALAPHQGDWQSLT